MMKEFITNYRKAINPPYRTNDLPVLFLTFFVLSALVLILSVLSKDTNHKSNAATVANTVEPENGALSGNTTIVTAPNASGGKYIKFGLVNVSPTPSAPKGIVVAHYHTTGILYKTGQTAYESAVDSVRAAKEMGLDGFAVNTFNGPQADGVIGGLVDAANQIGSPEFKVFLSADMSLGFTANDIKTVMTKWGDNPHYLKVNGKPLLSTYAGQELGDNWWQQNVINPLAASGHPVTFIPYFDRSDPNAVDPTYANWTTVINTYPSANGLFNFGLPGSVPFYSTDPRIGHHWWSVLEGEENLAQALHDKGKPFMTPVSPYYWAVCHSARQYQEFQGSRGIENLWTSIINKQKPELVELVTWNDYGESTFFQPSRLISSESPSIPSQPHLGFYELSKYYISWFHTGIKPSITKDAVFYFYRTHPKAAVATNDQAACNIPVTADQLWGDVRDDMHIATALTAPAELRVTTGGQVKSYQVGAGIVQTDVPFSVGSQTIELWRNGQKIASGQGTAIINNPPAYNYNVYAGYVVSGGSDSNTWIPSDKWKTGYVADWFTN